MTLIKSISGIRGTIGGKPGETLSPVDVVKFTAAFGTWILKRQNFRKTAIVIGRDGRASGKMVSSLVAATLQGLGIDVTDLGLASTPTVEVAVTGSRAGGGIIITASHNPANWNALKLLNEKGEFLSADNGAEILQIVSSEDYSFEGFDKLGSVADDNSWNEKHIDQIIKLDLVDIKAIKAASLTVAVDCINSVGGIILPLLLNKLEVKRVILLNPVPDGNFAHNPEPLPENLKEISETVVSEKADVGFVVDPDVDRLAIICEDGTMFGEEYTLVAVADYILQNSPGNTVSNMSSTMALKDITESYGGSYFSSSVGEVNVVEEMKLRKAVIGGEGNGGIIYPVFHYGRDALAGIALFLTYLSRRKIKCSMLRRLYPEYVIAKKKITLDPGTDVDKILESVRKHFAGHMIDERDGLRIENETGWVHIRKSNTEPIIRIYAEGKSSAGAESLANDVIEIVKKL
ncbi:MAG: phosphoglucosamine mutase [Odoribacter sp.]|nr:phosphoglucosamine mutase [Odoribacter sp.]